MGFRDPPGSDGPRRGSAGTDTESVPDPIVPGLPPEPVFTVTPRNPAAGQTVTLDASDTDPREGSITSYTWEVPGATKAGQTIQHQFPSKGDYTVTLIVTDSEGFTNTVAKRVSVKSGPAVDREAVATAAGAGAGLAGLLFFG